MSEMPLYLVPRIGTSSCAIAECSYFVPFRCFGCLQTSEIKARFIKMTSTIASRKWRGRVNRGGSHLACRDTSLMIKHHLLGPDRKSMPRAPSWSYGMGIFL